MRKLTILIAATLSGALMLSSCGNFGKNADKPNREDATIILEDEKAGGSLETGDGYGFTSFELDIEVDGKDAIEAEYQVGKKLDVDYDNKLTNIKLKDSAAMDELGKLFMDILITKDTPPQEVIDKILKWYQLDSYSKFDLEVDFDDGTRLDIEEVQ
ncbi:YusW family protein [Sporosarcina sp. FSL K6-3457]|uniref:YusW family protein n=1 Tax=Sporosarcina sp. FSL K6-3457 TaxID=2978204 RepID=UPI0030F79BCD